MAFQEVNVKVYVGVDDDAADDAGEQVVKQALQAEDSIEYVEIARTSVLLER